MKRGLIFSVFVLLAGCQGGASESPDFVLMGQYASELKLENCNLNGGMVKCDVTNVSGRTFSRTEMAITCLDADGAILGEFKYPRRDGFIPAAKYRDEWFAECGSKTWRDAKKIVVSVAAR